MKTSYVSIPFIVSAVVILFVGSSIGAIWLMTIFNYGIPQSLVTMFQQHRILQIDGFLTLLIMGIGYMIIPRFRNVILPSKKFAYLSFFLVITSLVIQMVMIFFQTSILADNISFFTAILFTTMRVSGISIFVVIIFLMLKIQPRRLRLSDYFIALSVLTLLALNVVELVNVHSAISSEDDAVEPLLRFGSSLRYIELWLLFPITMIFGIEYKTLPSFLGFIRPQSNAGLLSFILISCCVIFGLLSMIFYTELLMVNPVFNLIFFASVITFIISIYALWGFDNSEIRSIIQGEKKVRYNLTVVHIKGSFLVLLFGIFMATLFDFTYGQDHKAYQFVLYDLAIHTIAIGFIGITISLYLPLMLPPIVGKTVKFTNLNKIPLLLIILSLGLRGLGDFILALGNPVLYPSLLSPFFTNDILYLSLGLSGWLVIIAMIVFVILVHRSMK